MDEALVHIQGDRSGLKRFSDHRFCCDCMLGGLTLCDIAQETSLLAVASTCHMPRLRARRLELQHLPRQD